MPPPGGASLRDAPPAHSAILPAQRKVPASPDGYFQGRTVPANVDGFHDAKKWWQFWRHKTTAPWIATGLTLLLVAAGGFLLFPQNSPDGSDGAAVDVYLHDLPGGCQRLRVTLADVLVGPDQEPLEIVQRQLVVTDAIGLQQSVHIARGTVDAVGRGDLTLVFARAECSIGGAWIRLGLDQGRLTVAAALRDSTAGSHAVAFDLDAAGSLESKSDGSLAFRPLIRAEYYVAGQSGTLKVDPARDADQFEKVEGLAQTLEKTATDLHSTACTTLSPCSELPLSSSSLPSTSLPFASTPNLPTNGLPGLSPMPTSSANALKIVTP